MKMLHYILDADHRVVRARNLYQWAKWFEDINNRRVDETVITKDVRVSTVFLGIDHRYSGKGPPLLFETMIFGGPEELDQWTRRYSSWDDAEIGHKAAVRIALAAIKKNVTCAVDQ